MSLVTDNVSIFEEPSAEKNNSFDTSPFLAVASYQKRAAKLQEENAFLQQELLSINMQMTLKVSKLEACLDATKEKLNKKRQEVKNISKKIESIESSYQYKLLAYFIRRLKKPSIKTAFLPFGLITLTYQHYKPKN